MPQPSSRIVADDRWTSAQRWRAIWVTLVACLLSTGALFLYLFGDRFVFRFADAYTGIALVSAGLSMPFILYRMARSRRVGEEFLETLSDILDTQLGRNAADGCNTGRPRLRRTARLAFCCCGLVRRSGALREGTRARTACLPGLRRGIHRVSCKQRVTALKCETQQLPVSSRMTCQAAPAGTTPACASAPRILSHLPTATAPTGAACHGFPVFAAHDYRHLAAPADHPRNAPRRSTPATAAAGLPAGADHGQLCRHPH
jgi:hypothetical protein